jgi:signal transduction histidine kinase/ActR/RegA family two-component response regulator
VTPPPRRLSLQAVLIAAFVVVALVAIAFLSAQRYVWITTDLLEEQLDRDLALARSVAASVDRYLALRRELVESLAAEIAAVGLARRAAARGIVDTARRREPALSTVLVLDARGVVVAASPATDEEGHANVGKRFGDRDWFREIGRGEVLRSYDLASRFGARPALAVAASIPAFPSPTGGVLVGVLSLEHLRRCVRDLDPGRRDRLVVVDSQGRVVVHASRRWEDDAHDLSSEGVFMAAQRAAEGTTRYASQFTGTAKWGSYARLAGSGWVVWTTRDLALSEEKMFPLVRALVLSGVVALALATAASVVVTRLLIRPLRTLTAATRAVGDGGLPRGDFLEQRDSRISEFSELLGGFRAMADRLRGQYDELEAKVAERTTALEAAARESQAVASVLRTQDQIRRGYGELAALLNSLDRSHILNESTRKIAASLRAPTVAVYLVDESAGLHLKTYAALDPEMVDTTLLSPAGLPSQVARRGEPIVLDLTPGGERLRLMTGLGALEIGAVAGLPLRYQDSLLGVLAVALLEPLTEDTRSFLENAARQLSVALSNAGLFESLRFQSQQLERLNVELRQASELKSQFLASMSHELRTPLNSIIGFTELLLMSGREPLTERQRAALDKVHGNARHLLALINDVLDIARIQSGRMDVTPEPFVLDTLVRECVATVEPQAQAKGLLLRVTGLEQVGTLVQDRGKLKQILINLLSNAVTFTPVGSVEVRVSADAETVTIAVADTGIGIPPEDHAIIFEEFRRSDATEAGRPAGTGLGLAISRRLASLMRGSLTLESTSGRGSVFTLRLPTPARAGRPSEPGRRPAGEAARVLVIDDDADVVDIVRQTLADEAIGVESAPSARAGVALARARGPAVILLDLVLRGHDDGWEVLQQLKADPATRDIPVVVHSMIDNAERARRLGADEVLVKPVAPAVLRSLLRALVARPAAMASAGDR